MFKRDYLVSYHWESKNYGTGYGHVVFDWIGKIKADEIYFIKEKAKAGLKEKFNDENEYFNIVILNIVKF